LAAIWQGHLLIPPKIAGAGRQKLPTSIILPPLPKHRKGCCGNPRLTVSCAPTDAATATPGAIPRRPYPSGDQMQRPHRPTKL